MPSQRRPVPTYCLHKQSDRARAVWTDAGGVRHFRPLPGGFESSESRAAFDILLLELEASPTAVAAPAQEITVAEVMLAYIHHAERHYRGANGRPTSEFTEIKLMVKTLREKYGEMHAAGVRPAPRSPWTA